MTLRSVGPSEAKHTVTRFPQQRLSDAELIAAMVQGDHTALGVVWDRYSPSVRALLRASLGPHAQCEEWLQEVFLALHQGAQRAARLRGNRSLQDYILDTALRITQAELRTRRWTRFVAKGELTHMAALQSDPDAAEVLRALYRLLDRMPPRRRLAFVLRYVQGTEVPAAARSLRMSETALEREAGRARARILTWVSKDDPRLGQFLTTATATAASTAKDEVTQLAELARAAAVAAVEPIVQRSGRAALIAAADALRDHRVKRIARWGLTVAATFTGVAMLAVAIIWQTRAPALSYRVNPRQETASDHIAVPRHNPSQVRFSDGSGIIVEPGAELSVESTDADGAHVRLAHGSSEVHLAKRHKTGQAHWSFQAGPFHFEVSNADANTFQLQWDRTPQTVDLIVQEGTVDVSSPLGMTHCVVHGGQHFAASLSAGTLQLESTPGAATEPVAQPDVELRRY